MSNPDLRPSFNLPDWGQTASKTRTQEDTKENRGPLIEAGPVDTKDEKDSVAAKSTVTTGRKESVATKLGWSTTFTMDEEKREGLVKEALRRESVAAQQRKESMAIEATIEAQKKKKAIFVSPNIMNTKKSQMDHGFSTQTLRSKSDSDGPLDTSRPTSDHVERSKSIAGPDFGVPHESASFGRRPSQADHVRRDSMRHDRRPSYADTLFERGRLPGIVDEEEEPRRPGDKDEAGNKIHRQGAWSRILHWELDAANAEDKNKRRRSRFSDVSEASHDSHGRRKSGNSDSEQKQERRESGYSSSGGRKERKRSEYERMD